MIIKIIIRTPAEHVQCSTSELLQAGMLPCTLVISVMARDHACCGFSGASGFGVATIWQMLDVEVFRQDFCWPEV